VGLIRKKILSQNFRRDSPVTGVSPFLLGKTLCIPSGWYSAIEIEVSP
jgi:hypothetical protein